MNPTFLHCTLDNLQKVKEMSTCEICLYLLNTPISSNLSKYIAKYLMNNLLFHHKKLVIARRKYINMYMEKIKFISSKYVYI